MNTFARLIDILLPRKDTRVLFGDEKDRLPLLLSPRSFYEGTSQVVLLFFYEYPLVRACIIEAKYEKNKQAWKALAEALADYLLEHLSDMAQFERRKVVLLPIPLSKERFEERGYNQVEEVLKIALPSLPHCVLRPDLLIRVRNTTAQTELSREERKENPRRAFRAPLVLDDSFTYIVVDDVLTTGATMHDALRALKEAGAKDIIAIALAH